jgi:hypothetical protein
MRHRGPDVVATGGIAMRRGGSREGEPDGDPTDRLDARAAGKVVKSSRLPARPPTSKEENADAPGEPLQEKAAAGPSHEDPFGLHLIDQPTRDKPAANTGSGLPADVAASMGRSFGTDFSAVRVHEGSEASAMGARAFTQGRNIHFAPGEYDPRSASGLELIGHELTHVVQQAEGRVGTNVLAKGVSLNDDETLEHEADERGASAARGLDATPSAAPSSIADDVDETADSNEVNGGTVWSSDGESPSASSVQTKATAAPIQAKRKQRRNRGRKQRHIRFRIAVTRVMTADEYKAAAMRQVFGAAVSGIEWSELHETYTPDESPYILKVEIGLLKSYRAHVNSARGMETDATGEIAGAAARAAKFKRTPSSGDKSAVIAEIDRRYRTATGAASNATEADRDEADIELWQAIRDEVLFQHEVLANLSPKLKHLIRMSLGGRHLEPADYDDLFRIARKLEALPPGQASDYASKIAGGTTDLKSFERAIDRYQLAMEDRAKESEERDSIKVKLLGLEEVYREYRIYKSAKGKVALADRRERQDWVQIARDQESDVAEQLKQHGFASINEFEQFIRKFESAFEKEAVHVVTDLLQQYASVLYKESTRYRNPAEVAALHANLGGFRARHEELERSNINLWDETRKQTFELSSKKREAVLGPARSRATAANTATQASIASLAEAHPIFREDGLPEDHRVNQAALARSDESQLGGLLQSHIARRTRDIREAQARIDDKPELIYKMDKLMPQFYAQQGIAPGSIYDLIVHDKLRDDSLNKIATGVVLALVAIALSVISGGTAIPALAAAAGVAGLGIGMQSAFTEVQEYAEQQDLADVGLAAEPSTFWLTVAIIGAGFDAAAAVKAIRALGPAARTFNASGNVKEFEDAVKVLEASGEIDARTAKIADSAAAAHASSVKATDELTRTLAAKAYASPGPFVDPGVHPSLVKMASAKLKEGHSVEMFLDELKRARELAKLGDLTPEELARVKEAWEEAKALERSAPSLPSENTSTPPDASPGQSTSASPKSATPIGSTHTTAEFQLRGRLATLGADPSATDELLDIFLRARVPAATLLKVTDDALRTIITKDVLSELRATLALQEAGRIKGLDDWLAHSASALHDHTSAHLAELRDARRLAAEEPTSMIVIGRDASAPLDATTGAKLQSFDTEVRSSSGDVVRSAEVKSEGLVMNPTQVHPGITHAIQKANSRIAAGMPVDGALEATVPMKLRVTGPAKKSGTVIHDALGNRVRHTRDGRQIAEGNFYDTLREQLPDIPGIEKLSRVTLVDLDTGAILAQYEKVGGAWTRTR